MAGYFRRSVTKSEHLRGNQIPEEELLKAMDVCQDWILRQRYDRKIRQIAKRELFNLEEILEDESDDRTKCERIYLRLLNTNPKINGAARARLNSWDLFSVAALIVHP